jgi:hypothetical protein
MMKTPAPDDSSTVEYKPTKRKKPSKYSNRTISWEEQQQLPHEFSSLEKDFWPTERILKEKTGPGGKKYYLVEWKSHPFTHEEFKPNWVCWIY